MIRQACLKEHRTFRATLEGRKQIQKSDPTTGGRFKVIKKKGYVRMTHFSALGEIAAVVLNLHSIFKKFERMREMAKQHKYCRKKSLNFQKGERGGYCEL